MSGSRRSAGFTGMRSGLLAALLVAGLGAATAAADQPTSSPASSSLPVAGRPPERLLLIALDAVPYSTVAELTDPGRGERTLFRDFSGPAAMISSFPSTTNIAMAGLLAPFGAAPSPGYEARFFDHRANRLRGGGAISYHLIDFPWRDLFDWQEPGLVSGMVAKLRPVRATEEEIRKALAKFTRSTSPIFLIYVANTDGIGHLDSPAALEPVLTVLDRELRELRSRPGAGEFHVVLFSDHGMAGGEPLENVRGEVRRRLRAAHFRVAQGLHGDQDAVIAELGMVSSFEVHTRPGYEGRAAAAVVAVPGVELCAYRNPYAGGEGWEVVGTGGSAWFGRREGSRGDLWAYRPRSGDPLGYGPVAERLGRETAPGDGSRGAPAGADWFSGDAWFEATVEHRFPDALHRLARSFELVSNPASVTCSVAPGHMFAAHRTAAVARVSIGRLRWTHGALDREPTLGFLMSDLPGWRAPAAVRFDRALVPFARAAAEIRARVEAPAASRPEAVARREK